MAVFVIIFGRYDSEKNALSREGLAKLCLFTLKTTTYSDISRINTISCGILQVVRVKGWSKALFIRQQYSLSQHQRASSHSTESFLGLLTFVLTG